MKGTIKLYFNAENIQKVRSRVENPSKELSSQLREAIQKSAAEVLNANILDMRAKMIAKFQGLGLTIKDAKHAAALANPLQPFFDVVVSLTPFAGGEDENDVEAGKEETEEEEAGDGGETPSAEAPAKKPKKAKKEEAEDFNE